MGKKIIKLTTQQDLKIYMSPQRQKIMRNMYRSDEPMTPKAMADLLGVAPSSAQYHIKKLKSLGIVELDHTENINGITAKFYRLADIDVHIGTDPTDGLDGERKALLQSATNDSLNNLLEVIKCKKKDEDCPKIINGEFLNGILHLTREDADKLMNMIGEFIHTHEKKSEETSPWEYTLILYNAGIIEKGEKK